MIKIRRKIIKEIAPAQGQSASITEPDADAQVSTLMGFKGLSNNAQIVQALKADLSKRTSSTDRAKSIIEFIKAVGLVPADLDAIKSLLTTQQAPAQGQTQGQTVGAPTK